jgi:hypothetical protein
MGNDTHLACPSIRVVLGRDKEGVVYEPIFWCIVLRFECAKVRAFSAVKICTVLAGCFARFRKHPTWEISALALSRQGRGIARVRAMDGDRIKFVLVSYWS